MDIVVGQIVKFSEEQQMAYGWASVVSEKGKPVVDLQDDIIPVDVMEKAATEFMTSVRLAKAMHEGGGIGEVVHSYPITSEIAKALGLETDREGWIVGVKIHDPSIWSMVKSGELSAFSIGGSARTITVEEVDA